MLAEVISIGDELASGERLDTNSQWLSQRLAELGVAVQYHTTVADDMDSNVAVFRQAVGRADIVVASGGLGPTADDLTREALTGMLGVPLELDSASLEHIRELFAHRKREMPERNVVQAMFPRGSRVIPNPHGTAPGIDLIVPPPAGRPSRLFALPGVPEEMKEMWQASVAPRLIEHGAGQEVIRHRRIKCFGVGESDLEQMLPDLIRRGRQPAVGITVHAATITLRITARGRTPQDCAALMAPTEATIHDCLGSLVFGYEDDELQDVVVRLLAERGQTLATVEWGTAGLVARWLGDVPDAEAAHRGGLTLNGSCPIEKVLPLAEHVVEQHGEISGEFTAALAAACRQQFAADYALAVGKFPVFDPETSDSPHYYFALAGAEGVTVRSSPYAAHPSILKARAGKQALNLLRLHLLACRP